MGATPTRAFLALDANEGRCVLDEKQLASVLSPEIARRYPDARRLERVLADRFGVDPERVIATAGADDAIDRAFRSLPGPGALAATLKPGFVEYLHASKRSGVRFEAFTRKPGDTLDVEGFDAFLHKTRPALVVIASPDNPSGTVIDAAILLRIAKTCASIRAVLLLDLTYLDFADDRSIFEVALDLPQVLLTGSFSKSRGLAGFRSGWAVSGRGSGRDGKDNDIVEKIRLAGPPYSLSSPAIEASLVALQDCESKYQDFIAQVKEERMLIGAALASKGAKTWPMQGNFVSAFVRDEVEFATAMKKRGVLIRIWPNDPQTRGLTRITCPGDRTETSALLKIIDSLEEA